MVVPLFCNAGNLMKLKSDLSDVKLISKVHFRVFKFDLESSLRGK